MEQTTCLICFLTTNGESTFPQQFCSEFSFRLINFSRSYSIKQKAVFLLAHHIYEVQKIQKTHQIHNASPKAPGTEYCTQHDVSNQINSRCTNEDIKCLPRCGEEYRTSHKVYCGHIHTTEHSRHTVWGGTCLKCLNGTTPLHMASHLHVNIYVS